MFVPVLLLILVPCSYQYGGKVPANLACLHASFAHYCPKQDQYEVKVLYANRHEGSSPPGQKGGGGDLQGLRGRGRSLVIGKGRSLVIGRGGAWLEVGEELG